MLMKAIRIGVGLAALAFAAPLNAGEAPGIVEGFYFCNNIRATTTSTLYVSKLFESNAGRGEVYAAFQAMLAEKYGVTSQVTCSLAYKSPGIREKLEGDNQRWLQQVRAAGAKVVDTGWQYGTGTVAAPAIAPVASAAPAATSKTYQCWMNGFGGSYITPAFESSREFNVLNIDWRAYITQAHPPKGYAQTRCVEMDAKQAAIQLAQAGRTRVDWKE